MSLSFVLNIVKKYLLEVGFNCEHFLIKVTIVTRST